MEPKSKELILAVDDQSNNLSIISTVLSPEYNLSLANGGNAALKSLENSRPSLILLDVMMPDLDGFEVCRRIKANDKICDIPVIFLTAKTDVNDLIKGFELGAVDYITKPFNPTEVKTRVKNHINLFNAKNEIKRINSELIDSKNELKESNNKLNQVCEHLETIVEDRTRDLKAAKERAEEMSKLKSHFLSNMSHELRTPLVAILGGAEILALETESSELNEWASMIYDSGKRLLETLNLILDLSKIEADKIDVKYSTISLNSLINECIKLFTPMAKRKGLALNASFYSPDIKMIVDERLIREVLYNLINNGIKFTKQGNVTVDVSLNNSHIVIKVIDTGIGIPAEKFEYIFDEFRQVSEGMSRAFEGAGLGLSITKRFVELLQGKITVESRLYHGSTFSVYLPARLLHHEPVIIPKENKLKYDFENKVVNNKTILIIEDDEYTRVTLRHFLKKYYRVDFAEKGLEAIEKGKNFLYDLIVVDINLGMGLSGLDVIEELKKTEHYKSIPFVALTAFAMIGDKEEFLEKGCTHYLSKPYEYKELLGLLDRLLSNE